MRKNLYWLSLTVLLIIPLSNAAYASETLEDIYAPAFSDAVARHYRLIDEQFSFYPYDTMYFTFADITGDGEEELIIRHIENKHIARIWSYGIDDGKVFYMDDFECDAYTFYGYEEGILYREHYKGFVKLGLAEWDGESYYNQELYTGGYARENDPPSVESLSDYYDESRLLYEFPEFQEVDLDRWPAKFLSSDDNEASAEYHSSEDPFDLSNYEYRSVKIDGKDGCLEFQSSPNGSFMDDFLFWDGDEIFVNTSWREGAYTIAYKDGTYGYVDANYINWNSSDKNSNTSDGAKWNEVECGAILQIVNCEENISLRDAPSSEGEILTKIPLGDTASYIEYGGDGYACVEYHGIRGFARTDYLEVVS